MRAVDPEIVRPRFIAIDGAAGSGETAALDFGPQDRPVDVVFLHANGFNALTYRTILGPIGRDLRILALDQRGHGYSRLPADPVGRRSWLDLQDDLIAVLETLGGPPPVLAGHSMGGTVCVLAAAARPDLARRLVLFDPVILSRQMLAVAGDAEQVDRHWRESPMTLGALKRRADFPDRAAAFAAYQGRGAFKTWPDAVLADYVEAGFRDTDDGVTLSCTPAWEASGFSSHAHNVWTAAEAAPQPITLLRAEIASTCNIGEQDQFGRPGAVDQRVIPGTTHFLPMERPDLVAQALTEAVRA